MSDTTVLLVSSAEANNTLAIPQEIGAKLALGEGNIEVRAGQRLSSAKVTISESRTPNQVRISSAIVQELLLPEETPLRMRVDQGALVLGPVLGVFVSVQKLQALLTSQSDRVYQQFLSLSAAENGLIFLFTLNDIQWSENKVRGYRLVQGQWTPQWYPLPNVIYDRSFGVTGNNEAWELRQRIALENSADITVYNQAAKIRKQETYEHLSKYSDLSVHILPFAPLTDDMLASFLQTTNTVYLKPDALYTGKGIAQVSKEGKRYALRMKQGRRTRIIMCNDVDSLLQTIRSELDLGLDYLLQSDIGLASVMGNQFDIRVMLQKERPDEWQVTAAAARIMPEEGIVSSPRSGGKVVNLVDALRSAFPTRVLAIMDSIRQFCCAVGVALEEKFGFLGELGIDVGLDSTGKLWLIEVNGKPLKVSLKRLRDRLTTRVVHETPIRLGFSLDGFPSPMKHPTSIDQPERFDFQQVSAPHQHPIIYLDTEQLCRWELEYGQTISLRVGNNRASVEIRAREQSSGPNRLLVTQAALQLLGIPGGTTLNLLAVSPNQLVFGPTVGLMISSHSSRRINRKSYLQLVARRAQEKGIFFYCFAPEQIDWEKRQVHGHYMPSSGARFEKSILPFPQVISDKATFPNNPEKREKLKETYARIGQTSGVELLNNRRFLGKWETYNALTFFRETRQWVPATTLLTLRSLRRILSVYPVVYAKSNYGSLGAEVYRIRRQGGYYLCQWGGRRVLQWDFASTDHLYEFLSQKLGKSAVVQQGITLRKLGDRPFDMRFIVQKDQKGVWQLPHITIRAGFPLGVVTNRHLGGAVTLKEHGDKLPFNLNWGPLTAFSQKIGIALESSFGRLGEVGVDVGLCTRNGLWLFEANAKPRLRSSLFLEYSLFRAKDML